MLAEFGKMGEFFSVMWAEFVLILISGIRQCGQSLAKPWLANFTCLVGQGKKIKVMVMVKLLWTCKQHLLTFNLAGNFLSWVMTDIKIQIQNYKCFLVVSTELHFTPAAQRSCNQTVMALFKPHSQKLIQPIMCWQTPATYQEPLI